MAIPVGTILKVVASLVYPADAGINQNVFNAIIAGSGGPFDDDEIVEDALFWVANMFANLVGAITEEMTGSQVQVYRWDPVGDDWDEVGSIPWTFNPTETAEYLPRGVAALVLARTVNPDVLGKKYIPGFTEDQSSDGLWVSTAITGMLAYAADWVLGFAGDTSGATWDPGVWSPTMEAIFDMSETVIANNIPAYQRRRKRGVGI